MSDNSNPYASTQTGPGGPGLSTGEAHITSAIAGYLKEASPWIRFIAVIGFIQAGFVILMGIIFALMGPYLGFSDPGSISSGLSAGAAVGIFIFAGIIIIAIGIVIIIPFRYLYNFGAKIRYYVLSNNEQALELALKNNKAYWKFLGIFSIVMLAAVPVLVIITVAVAVTSSIF